MSESLIMHPTDFDGLVQNARIADQVDSLAYAMGLTIVQSGLVAPGKAYLLNTSEVKIRMQEYQEKTNLLTGRFRHAMYGVYTMPRMEILLGVDWAERPRRTWKWHHKSRGPRRRSRGRPSPPQAEQRAP